MMRRVAAVAIAATPVVVLLTGSNLDRRMWAHEAAWLAAFLANLPWTRDV